MLNSFVEYIEGDAYVFDMSWNVGSFVRFASDGSWFVAQHKCWIVHKIVYIYTSIEKPNYDSHHFVSTRLKFLLYLGAG